MKTTHKRGRRRRLRRAIGDTATNVERDEQLQAVERMLRPTDKRRRP